MIELIRLNQYWLVSLLVELVLLMKAGNNYLQYDVLKGNRKVSSLKVGLALFDEILLLDGLHNVKNQQPCVRDGLVWEHEELINFSPLFKQLLDLSNNILDFVCTFEGACHPVKVSKDKIVQTLPLKIGQRNDALTLKSLRLQLPVLAENLAINFSVLIKVNMLQKYQIKSLKKSIDVVNILDIIVKDLGDQLVGDPDHQIVLAPLLEKPGVCLNQLQIGEDLLILVLATFEVGYLLRLNFLVNC